MIPTDHALLVEVFLGEAREILALLAGGVTRLRSAGEPLADAVAPLLVLTHRLKGAAAQYGYGATADVAGLVEEVLRSTDRLSVDERDRVVASLTEAIALLARGLEKISASRREELVAVRGEPQASRAEESENERSSPSHRDGADIRDSTVIRRTVSILEEAVAGRFSAELERFRSSNTRVLTYFLPECAEHLDTMSRSLAALERDGAGEHELAGLFRTVHTLKGASYTVGCTPVGDVAHAIEDLLASLREGFTPLSAAVVDLLRAGVEVLRWLLAADGPSSSDERLAGLLARAHAAVRVPEPAPPPRSWMSEVSRRRAESEESENDRPGKAEPGQSDRRPPASSSIRIASDRLDSLLNLIGELIVVKARLDRRVGELERLNGVLLFSRSRMVRTVEGFESADDLEFLGRSVAEVSSDLAEVHTELAALTQGISQDSSVAQQLIGTLRTEITRARMLPLGGLFQRCAAQVREAASAGGKAVRFEASGATVEVDRAIIEQVSDPVIQLLQNALSHGLELPEERRAAGKPADGTISVRATHRGGAIRLDVEDDGRGIDLEVLRARAAQTGFVGPAAAAFLSGRELLDLIFLPGFTTAEAVTKGAGRGVGLDVVRTNLARLNGNIEVETRAGHGTRFTLTIPTTVVISDALLVRAGGETFAVPLTAIDLVLSVRPEGIQSAGTGETVCVQDQVTELIRLDRLLGLPPSPPAPEVTMLVVRAGGKSVAVAVDELLGKEDIVIKSLGGYSHGIGVFSGGTIASDGRVILVVDPSRVLQASPRLLPVLADARPAPSAELAPASPVSPDAARRFLLVDDSISVRKFVGQMLERAGFTVVTAIDGADALQQLERNAIHAVVTDLEMPRINGYELIEHLQRRPSTRDLPIVVLTSRSGARHEDLARQLGVKHYLTKPVDERALVDLLASLVSSA